MLKISVIVPVYKAEQYVGECIESILVQTYTNLELILVDDGSPDNSGIICDQYAKTDSRIKVFHQKNGGVSSARNYGIEHATGEWLCFVDSDDTVDSNYIEYLAKGFNYSSDVDLVIAGYRNVDEKSSLLSIRKFDEREYSTDIASLLSKSELNNTINSPVCKLFKKEIIIKNNIKYNSSLSYGEDHIFVLEYAQYVRAIYLSNKVVYNYFHRSNDSLTGIACNPNEMIKYVIEVKKAYELLNKKLNSDIYQRMYCHQLHDHLIRATYFLLISKLKNKRLSYYKIHSVSRDIKSGEKTSPFYKLIWICLQFPARFSYPISWIIAHVKYLIVS